jgi:hypothetical protein
MKSMFKGDARFMEPTPDAIAKLDLETVSKAVFDQLKTGDMEVRPGSGIAICAIF